MKPALFIHDVISMSYLPANKNAVGVCAILSKMKLRDDDMPAVKSKGYEPMLTNGEKILKVNITV